MIGQVLLLWCTTPVHPGIGWDAGGIVDLSIQKECSTGLPFIPASSLKGAFRSRSLSLGLPEGELTSIFGSIDAAGGLLFADAHLLFFPVTSLRGGIAWVTSPLILMRFNRTLKSVGISSPEAQLPSEVPEGRCLIPPESELTIKAKGKNWVVLYGEIALEADPHDFLVRLMSWLAQMLPNKYLQKAIPRRILAVDDGLIKMLVERGLDYLTRIRLRKGIRKVKEPGLWTEECLPSQTLLYTSLTTTCRLADSKILNRFLSAEWFQLGGDESTGRGFIKVTKVV